MSSATQQSVVRVRVDDVRRVPIVGAAVARERDDRTVRVLDRAVDDQRSEVEAGPVVAVYRRVLPEGRTERASVTVTARAVVLGTPHGARIGYSFANGYRLVRVAVASGEGEETWLLLDDARRAVAWLLGVPKDEAWRKESGVVARSARALGLA